MDRLFSKEPVAKGSKTHKGLLIYGTAHLSTEQATTSEKVWVPQKNEHTPWTKNSETSPQARTKPPGSRLRGHVRQNAYPPDLRLKKRRDFVHIQRVGRHFASDKIVIRWTRSSNDHTRLGLTVPCRFGSSVERNLFRRRAREAFRISTLKAVPGIDLNVKPRGTEPVSYDEFCQTFQRFERAVSRL